MLYVVGCMIYLPHLRVWIQNMFHESIGTGWVDCMILQNSATTQ